MTGLEQDGGTSAAGRADPPPPFLKFALSCIDQLLFPACPGIHLTPSVARSFLQEPPEGLQGSPAGWDALGLTENSLSF